MRAVILFATAVALSGSALFAVAEATEPPVMPVRIVDQNGMPVANAVVTVYPQTRARDGRITFPWRNAMAQRNQQFVPGTLIVPQGATVAFPNLDTVRHSVYSFSRIARFEIDLYGRDQTRTQAFPIAGTVALGCNIHDNMRGYIRVVDTPFAAKTDQNGIVRIAGLPAGGASVRVWHPMIRTPTQESNATTIVSPAGLRMTVTIRN